jgi:hypothetical protein
MLCPEAPARSKLSDQVSGYDRIFGTHKVDITARIERRRVVGGLISEYRRVALAREKPLASATVLESERHHGDAHHVRRDHG